MLSQRDPRVSCELEEFFVLSMFTSSPLDELWLPVQDIFAMQNKEGISALNLPCKHGHINIVHVIDCHSLRVSWTDK